MNRRSFLQGVSALGLSALVPTWLVNRPLAKEIDLRPFCGAIMDGFDMSVPFCQELRSSQLFRFATDAIICVRVESDIRDKNGDCVKRPPASLLAWDNESKRKWMPWPEKRHELASETLCPKCQGDALFCDLCDGIGEGIFPAFQKVGDHYINCDYDDKIRQFLGEAEFFTSVGRSPERLNKTYDQIVFRFQGGVGIVCPLYPSVVSRRTRNAQFSRKLS